MRRQILEQLKHAPVGLVNYEGVIVRRLTLPENLNDAITRKLTEEQKAQVPQLIEEMKARAKTHRKHGRGNKEGKRRFM